MRNLARVRSVGVHYPNLRRPAAAIGDEIDLPPVRRPARTLVLGSVLRKLARSSAVDGDEIDLLRFDVLLDVGRLNCKCHLTAVGRESRLADALDLPHGGGVKGL